MLVEVLAGRVVVSGALDELQTRYGFRLSWSMEARWEIQSRVPKYSRASWTGTMMLNPRVECSTNSSLQNLVADGVMYEVWTPLAIPARIKAISHSGPTFTGKLFVA